MEAVGVLSALIIIRLLHTFMGQENWRQQAIHSICDNQGVVNQLNKVTERSMTVGEYYLPDSNILLQSIQEIKNLEIVGFQIEISYEKAYQDKNTKNLGPLTDHAALNVEADKKAKMIHVDTLIDLHNNELAYPEAGLYLKFDSKRMCSNVHKRVVVAYTLT